MGRILPFLKRSISRDWSAQELAEFYRVESALVQSGMNVVSDRGVTDEGDPWFVFYRPQDDDVIIHFARIGRRYLISAPSYGADVTGHDFKALTLGLLERQGKDRLAQATGNIKWHPSALLTMLVTSALIMSDHASAAAPRREESAGNGAERQSVPSAKSLLREHGADDPVQSAQLDTAVLIGVALAGASIDIQPFVTVDTAASGSLLAQSATFTPPPDLDPDGPSVMVGSSTPVAQPTFPVSDEPFHSANMASSQPAGSQSNAGPDYLIGHETPLANLVPVLLTSPAAEPAHLLDGLGARTDATAGIHNEAQWLLSLLGGGEPISNTSALPAALAAPLNASLHETTTNFHAPSATPLPVATGMSPPTAGANDASGGGSHQAAVVNNAPVVSTALAESNVSAVLTVMQQFAQQVGPHLAVMVTGNQVIEYDYYAVDHTPAAVSAVTYDFADGSHISLVGLPAELPHVSI